MNKEPEGLYPEYKQELTQKIAHITQTGESFRITAKTGMGKSKYIRYITSSPTIKEKYFSNPQIKLIHIDLNRVFDKDTQGLLKTIASTIDAKENTANGIEKRISNLLQNNDKVYLILNQAENLNEFPARTIRVLRSIRDNFKYEMGYIIAIEEGIEIDKQKFKQLLEICSIQIPFGTLTEQDSRKSLDILQNKMNVEITSEEKEKIIEFAKGYPKVLKQLLSQKLAGVSIDKAIINVEELNIGISDDIDTILNKAQKSMSKNEFLFFEKLYKNRGKVVTRDELAELLSPESKGSGVSNEAIDQVISRTRDAVDELKLPVEIKTKHGVGYFIEG